MNEEIWTCPGPQWQTLLMGASPGGNGETNPPQLSRSEQENWTLPTPRSNTYEDSNQLSWSFPSLYFISYGWRSPSWWNGRENCTFLNATTRNTMCKYFSYILLVVSFWRLNDPMILQTIDGRCSRGKDDYFLSHYALQRRMSESSSIHSQDWRRANQSGHYPVRAVAQNWYLSW